MIEVKNLLKQFGDVKAVNKLSFDIPDGKVIGLLGHNGAGKTTAIRIICGLMSATKGKVLIDNINVAEEPLRAHARIGVLPDSHGLYPRLTAREHIRYFGRLHGMNKRKIEEVENILIKRLGMEKIADRRTDGFSQGERMKVNLARALVHNPPTIILDEPTNGLDVMSARSVRQLVKDLKEEGKCVLFSSHIMHEVSELCDYILVISQGELAAQGTKEEILEMSECDNLEDAFVALTEHKE